MSDKKVNTSKTADKTNNTVQGDFIFGKQNYMLMALGVVVIIIGFFVMSGKDDIFSTTKLTAAPIIILLGFVIEIFAIMKKNND
ncbi:MAG: DUF3098 domain-containing protein [Bacteroidota bacterium]